MNINAKDASSWPATRFLMVGGVALALLVVGLGGWSALASISGAVVAAGRLQVEANRQVVQHPDGGVVDAIMVRDGDTVTPGQVLLRLDGDLLQTELSIIENQLFDARARIARLAAERDGASAVTFDAALLADAAGDDDLQSLLDVQARLFAARAETIGKQSEQLRTRQQQFGKEIAGLQAQQASTSRQLELIERELEGQRKLFEKGHSRVMRLYELERMQADLVGRVAAYASQIAETEGRIAEVEIETLRLRAAQREDAIAGLRDLRSEELDLAERQRATREKLARLEVTSPRAGIVLDMAVHAMRAVVRPAEPILYVVPSDSALVVEAEVAPAQIDDVFPSQPANLRFSAFNARTTPEVDGKVLQVSADALVDQATGAPYYLVQIAVDAAALEELGSDKLVPGMPVDVFLRTGERTPLSYLAKPFTDYFAKAMRES